MPGCVLQPGRLADLAIAGVWSYRRVMKYMGIGAVFWCQYPSLIYSAGSRRFH